MVKKLSDYGVTPRAARFERARNILNRDVLYWGHVVDEAGKYGYTILCEFSYPDQPDDHFYVSFTSRAVIETLNDLKARIIDELDDGKTFDEVYPVQFRVIEAGRTYTIQD